MNWILIYHPLYFFSIFSSTSFSASALYSFLQKGRQWINLHTLINSIIAKQLYRSTFSFAINLMAINLTTKNPPNENVPLARFRSCLQRNLIFDGSQIKFFCRAIFWSESSFAHIFSSCYEMFMVWCSLRYLYFAAKFMFH